VIFYATFQHNYFSVFTGLVDVAFLLELIQVKASISNGCTIKHSKTALVNW